MYIWEIAHLGSCHIENKPWKSLGKYLTLNFLSVIILFYSLALSQLHIFSFSWLKIRLFKILQTFLHIWNGMVKGFSKMYNFSLFGQFLCKHFYCITGFCDKKFNFCKFANFIADSKSRAQELSNDVSFVIFWYQTWDLEGGQIDSNLCIKKYFL